MGVEAAGSARSPSPVPDAVAKSCGPGTGSSACSGAPNDDLDDGNDGSSHGSSHGSGGPGGPGGIGGGGGGRNLRLSDGTVSDLSAGGALSLSVHSTAHSVDASATLPPHHGTAATATAAGACAPSSHPQGPPSQRLPAPPPSDSSTSLRSSARSPEGLLRHGSAGSYVDPYTTASDVYSLGVVLWELLTCAVRPPIQPPCLFYPAPPHTTLFHRVCRGGSLLLCGGG